MATKRQVEANRRNWAKRGPLTPAGRERLRRAALRNRPWERSTGPVTDEGKARSALNSLRHGRETTECRSWRRDALRFIRLDLAIRNAILGKAKPRKSPDALLRELVRLADRLN